MGLLDDAIREHLDLKRRSGGDPAEIERMEREALGPVRREPAPSVYTGATAVEEPPAAVGGHAHEGPASMHDPVAPQAPSTTLGGYEPETGEYAPQGELPPALHEAPPAEPTFYEDPTEEPQKRGRRFLRGLSALTGADERAAEPEPEAEPFDPLATVRPSEPAPPAPEPPARAAPPEPEPPMRAAPPPLSLSGEHRPGPDEAAPAPAEGAAASPAPPEPGVPTDEQATRVHRVDEALEAAADEAFPAPVHEPEPAPLEDEADPLEETPEFLQDTPEHDRLWFEQRPPRDFDFDQ